MNPVVWKMPPQPFYATQICRKSMLYGGVKKRFLLGCDKMFLLGPFKTLLHPNLLRVADSEEAFAKLTASVEVRRCNWF